MRVLQRWIGALVLLVVIMAAPARMPGQNAGGSMGQSAVSSPLTPELVAKMWKFASGPRGGDGSIAAVLAAGLGLGANGDAWMARIVAVTDINGSAAHAFAFGRGTGADNQDVVVSVKPNDGYLLAFRAHRDGTLVKAIRGDLKTFQVTSLEIPEAQAGFAAECAVWKENIDGLIAKATSEKQGK